MSRPLTPQELQILRSDGLATKVFAIIDQPVTVFSCKVNQTFTGNNEPVAQISYNNASGDLAKVLPGMTVLVGSTPGAWDKGLARVRKSWTSNIAYIGETSEITWQNGLYLTVVDEFSIWPRHLRMVGETPYMDYDIPYSDQHINFNPIVNMGTDRVVKLTGQSTDIALDASASWVFGSTITQYSWQIVSGNGTLSNASTSAPILTVNTPGRIVIRCKVTAANGKESTGYRTIYVYNDTTDLEIDLDDLSGSLDQGGYEFSFSLVKPLTTSIRDHLKVILFCEEQPQSIGAVSGAENILAVGWLDQKECVVDESGGQSRFVVRGAQYWLSRTMAYPSGVENTANAPTGWTQIQGLTVDKMIWHLLYWRSTVNNCSDIILSGDTRVAPSFKAVGTLWEQIKYIAEESILATPFFDPYNRFFLQIHPNYKPPSQRNSIPTIMTLTEDDYSEINISIRSKNISQCEVSGIGQNNEPIIVKAPGNTFGRHGQILTKERLLFADVQNALDVTGLMFSRENRAFDFTIRLVSANRVINLVPFAFLELNVYPNDTPAKVEFSGRVIPYRVEYTLEDGFLHQTIFAEPEIFPAPAKQIDIPSSLPIVGTPAIKVPDLKLPSWPALTPRGGFIAPILIPGDNPIPPVFGATCPLDAPANGPFVWTLPYTLFGYSYYIAIPVRAIIRSSSHDNKTVFGIRGRFLKRVNDAWVETSEDFWNIYAYNAQGQRIANGIKDTVTNMRYRTGTFQPPAATEIAYVSIEIEGDLLRPTAVSNHVWAGHFWDDWGVNNGQLSWGYLGSGIWASIVGASLTYNYSWTAEIGVRLGEYDEYRDINLKIRQRVIAKNQGQILGARGRLRDEYNLYSHQLWSESFNGTETPFDLWFVGKESSGALPTGILFVTTQFDIRPLSPPRTPPDGTRITMQYYVECFIEERYKIILESVELWNVCPVPGA